MHTPGPWTYDHRSGWINADNCCSRGPMHVADIRGWGHLTGHGHGAHGMTTDEGIAIQAANAELICSAPKMWNLLSEIASTHLGMLPVTDAVQAIWIAKARAIVCKDLTE